MLKFHCPCGHLQAVDMIFLQRDDGGAAWSDIVCSRCKLVIVTVGSSMQGICAFMVKSDHRCFACDAPSLSYTAGCIHCLDCGWMTDESFIGARFVAWLAGALSEVTK